MKLQVDLQENVAQEAHSESHVAARPELNLLLNWADEGPPRFIRDGVGSLVVHLLIALGLFIVLRADEGRVFNQSGGIEIADLRKATHLIAPPTQLTQKAPNVNKASKEINLESLLSHPEPAPSPGHVRFKAPAPLKAPGAGAPVIPEPPKIEAAIKAPQTSFGINTEFAPPPIPPAEKPKLAFETPGSPTSTVPPGGSKIQQPNATVDEAIRNAMRTGPGAGQAVGDVDDIGTSDPVRPSPQRGRTGSKLELLSDPKGIDFRPYLIQVLAAVRRNWFAVIPESARFGGRRGRVQVQFVIAKGGSVPKLVISSPSGTDALDRAAVASISASNPFPPLPPEFKGNEVRLQLSFMYNVN